jgi:hypothetical protein
MIEIQQKSSRFEQRKTKDALLDVSDICKFELEGILLNL